MCHEFLYSFSELAWLVFLNDVPAVLNHARLELTHHLSGRQIRVHSFNAGKEQHLGGPHAQEILGQVLEPALPELLSGQQVRAPHKLRRALRLVYLLDDLGWHGNASTSLVSHLA